MCAGCRLILQKKKYLFSGFHDLKSEKVLPGFNPCIGQIGQGAGPGSRPISKLGSASSTRFSTSHVCSESKFFAQVASQERAAANETAFPASVFLATGLPIKSN